MIEKNRHYFFILLASAFLSSCFEPSPPRGFEAVGPANQDNSQYACPNLIDTYQISSAQEHTLKLQEPTNSKELSIFVINSLVGGQAYNYTLRMEKKQFTDTAEELKKSDPEKYFYWRENIFKGMKAPYQSDEARASVLKFGPIPEIRGQFHIYSCKDGWTKIRETETSAQDFKTQENYIRQDDVWLARDKFGNLLIQTISYQQKPGWTFWAAGGAGTRLIPIDHRWNKILKIPDGNRTINWTSEDLPEIAPPVRNTNDCQLSPSDFVDFNQRLIQQNIIIEKFTIEPAAIKQNLCVQPSLIFKFSSSTQDEGQRVMDLLTKDPIVDRTELIETQMGADKRLHYLLKVSLKRQQ